MDDVLWRVTQRPRHPLQTWQIWVRLGSGHSLGRRARQRDDQALVPDGLGSLYGPFPQPLPSAIRRHGDEHEAGARPDAGDLSPTDGRGECKNEGERQKWPDSRIKKRRQDAASPNRAKQRAK